MVLAKALEVDVDELNRQIALQDAMDTMDFATLDPGFAEDGSALGTHFELWYRSAGEPNSVLKEAMAKAGVLEYVRFERVPLSLESLLTDAKRVYAAMMREELHVGVTIDTATGGVVLHPATEAARFSSDYLQAQKIAAESNLPFRSGDALPTPAEYGGKPLTSSTNNCTGGFVVNDGTVSVPNRKVSTAAHCVGQGESGITYAGVGGFFSTDWTYDSFYDYAFLDKAGVSWAGLVKYSDAGAQRNVDANRSWAAMDVGDPISKYGRTTGYTSGTIVSKFACGASPSCDPESIFVRAQVTAGPEFCDLGDSGGPNMWTNYAYGLTSARYPDGDCSFMPVQLMGNAVTGNTSHQ